MNKIPRAHNLRQSAELASADLPALMAAAEKAATTIMSGGHAQRKTGRGENFWQFRDYTAGDRPQDIDWRQSAKTQDVYIRQKEWQTTQKTFFWTSNAPSMNFMSEARRLTKANAARILTLALSILMTRGGENIGLLGNPKTGRSEKALQEIGAQLCDDTTTHTLPNPENAILPNHSALIQIGDFLDPIEDITTVFDYFVARADNGMVIQVLDPAELTLPYRGRAVFEAPSDDLREDIAQVQDIRAAYIARIEAHNEALQSLCRDHGWQYILHRTDSDIAETLSSIYHMQESVK